MSFVSPFDRVVADMMRKFGGKANIKVAVSEEYDVDTSENVVVYRNIPVQAIFADFLDKTSGLGTQGNTLIQSGDKQVYVRPPQKSPEGYPLPELKPNKDVFELAGKTYKIVFMKQHNPSMTSEGCVLYELYIRE